MDDQNALLIEDEGDEFNGASCLIDADTEVSLGLIVFDAQLSVASGAPGMRDGLSGKPVFER